MKALLSRIHAKLGDLWWYTILLFVAQRFGDVINMFVGLWIVPKYVPMEELGAVLPLTNVVTLIGVPLSIVAIPFLKFIAIMVEKGELGKAKAFIRDTFIGTGVFAVLSVLIAYWGLPFFFERLRVQNGSLTFLLVVITVLTAVSGISVNAVSALRQFTAIVWLSAIAAPLRLVLIVVLMPFRALTGYLAGGASAPLVNIVGSFFALRRFFCSPVRPQSYWRDYGRAILVYAWPLVLMTAVNAVSGNIDTLVIRHRLSEFESAGYYMITRFSDISMQVGSAFVAFVFPMLANRNGHDAELRQMIVQSSLGVLGVGLLIAGLLGVGGEALLSLKAEWSRYASLTPEMAGFAVSGALTMACTCITTAFVARSLFSFLWYCVPIGLAKCVILYALTGYGFFRGILPDAWLSAVEAFNPFRLSVVMWILLGANLLTLICLLGQTFARRRSA